MGNISLYFFSFLSISLLIIKNFLKIIFPVVLSIIILVIINVIINYDKYGRSVFRIFRKKSNPDYYDNLIFSTINHVKGNRKTIQLKNLFSDYLIIDEKGIFLLLLINESGVLSGDLESKYLNLKTSAKIMEIKNPYILVNEDLKKIYDKTGLKKIKPLIITKNDCIINLNTKDDIQFVKMEKLYEILSMQIGKLNHPKLDINHIYQLFKSTNYVKQE